MIDVAIAPSRATLVLAGRRPALLLAVGWLGLVLVAALAPDVLAPGDPLAVAPADRLQAPSGQHLFGTDGLGRDLLDRTVHGTGASVSAAIVATLVGLVVGSVVGLVAGSVGGWVDAGAMRLTEVFLAVPSLLLSLSLIAVLGPGTTNVAIAVGVASIATCARIMRSEVLRVRDRPYVEAARAGGARWPRLLVRHVLPNAMGPVWALAALEFAAAILAVSALSFLGYGAQPPAPEWGALVSDGRDYLRQAGWLTLMPGIVIALTVLAAGRLARAVDGDRGAGR